MDYAETALLMQNEPFRDRIQVACLKYATFVVEEAATTPAHSARIRWTQQTFASPVNSATQVQPLVVMDPAVQTAGAAITDAALQSAVEAAVNKIL